MLSRFATLGRIPRGVWILGGVSLLMDVSSEMIHSLLPLFMATTLGVSVIVIGLIEGLAEATALIVKVFSGVLSDYLGKRKGLALWGVHMGMTQGLLAAMVAHTAPAHLRGTAFGMFNLIGGAALLLASLGAGTLWELFGSASTFYAGAIICVVTLVGMKLAPFGERQGA